MIIDGQTNSLYLADTLPVKYPFFFEDFEKILSANKIKVQFLPGTRDVWAVDYMPVQIAKERFVQFSYQPTYLDDQRYAQLRSDSDEICRAINIKTIQTTIRLDGGNLVKATDRGIITDRVFTENPGYEKNKLIRMIAELLEIDRIDIIPHQPYDFTGHACKG